MDYKKEYRRLLMMLVKKGMRIKLINMNDENAAEYKAEPAVIAPGSLGTVDFVDDANQIHVRWDFGSSLAVIPECDEFEIVTKAR